MKLFEHKVKEDKVKMTQTVVMITMVGIVVKIVWSLNKQHRHIPWLVCLFPKRHSRINKTGCKYANEKTKDIDSEERRRHKTDTAKSYVSN